MDDFQKNYYEKIIFVIKTFFCERKKLEFCQKGVYGTR